MWAGHHKSLQLIGQVLGSSTSAVLAHARDASARQLNLVVKGHGVCAMLDERGLWDHLRGIIRRETSVTM
jgi:hypothetical protein